MRLNSYSIGLRVTTGFAIVLSLAIAIIVTFLLNRIDKVIQEAEHRELTALNGSLTASLDAEARLATTMSTLVTGIPEVGEALANGQRDRLAALFQSGFKALSEGYGVKQFQFHLPPATSFLRVHKPEKFGDDLSDLRPTIVETNRSKQPVSGLDLGVAGLGIRGLVPVFHQGGHVGSLEFGMSFGQSFFENFGEQYGVEAGLQILREEGLVPFASTVGKQSLLPAAIQQAALNGERPIYYTTVADKPVAVMGSLVKDYAGEPIGVVEIAMDRSTYIATSMLARNSALLIAALAMGVGLALALWLSRTIVGPIQRTTQAMSDIAAGEGDLTRRLNDKGRDELSELARQFNAFVGRMQNTLKEVRSSTRSVNRAAGDIAQGSEELATRTEQAAANLQETSASMEEITSTVNHSADSAQQANQLVQSTADVARQGEAAMSQVERTMEDINASATRIGEIITMIDAIAFQTNILALNASVEAARAGEHGRGFAVVAQEVRTLASRSSNASGEIRTLIDTSTSHTRSGAELVRNAGQTMREIVASVARVTDVIGEISAATREQSSGISQVNMAVMEMDSMTQQNAAMVQQSSTAAADMRRHALQLSNLINSFVLGEETTTVTQDIKTKNPAPSSILKQVSARQPAREEVEEWSDF
ncbi:methyl-accepting chemotaxis protein [Pistricoccus aurantiacus]|nr:methyl-accepting chemotaxis protein [Pistricoccus aurantiacus]